MRRRPGFAATAGLLVFGAMAAGFAGGLPESLRAIAALLVVLALPPFVLDRTLGSRAPGVGPFLRPLVAILVWIGMLALWTCVFILAHASFHGYATATMWLFLVFYAVCALFPLVRVREQAPRPAMPLSMLVLVAGCVLFAVVVPQRLTVGDDSLDHVGYVQHIMSEDAVRPHGVLALPAGAPVARPDPRKGALHPVWAFASALSGTEPLTIWRWLRLFFFPATVLALCTFNAAFLRSWSAATIAAALILLSFHGNPFRFAASSPHGESLGALWCWTLTALALCNARREIGWPVWMLLGLGGVLVHMGVAVHALVLAATVAGLGAAWSIPRADRVRIAGGLAAGVLVAMAARVGDLRGAVNPIHAHTQGVLFVAKHWFVASPMEILRLDGMLFLGGLVCVPLLVFVARADAGARAIVAAAVIPFVVSFVPWVATPLFHHGSYMVFRSLLNVPAYAAIVACALWLARGLRARRVRAWALGVPLALVWLVVFARPLPRSLAAELRAELHAGKPQPPVAEALSDVVMQLPEGAVILSDPATSYALSAVTSARFVAVEGQHANPRDHFALARLQAVRDVLSPYVLPSAAMNACRRFGVNYVIVNREPPGRAGAFLPVWSRAQYPSTIARMRAMEQAFALVDTVAGASIYRFEKDAPAAWSWSAEDQPVRVAAPSLTPCSVSAPGSEFEITGISLTPDHALPGDTVQVTLGYLHDAASSFGLPVVMHIRFDHEMLARAHEYPGEKLTRRFVDGRAGVRSRFRADLAPGHGVYDADLWPVGFALCETFAVVVPPNLRQGHYDVRVAVAYDAVVPNFHLRDMLYNRDHYSGRACASLTVVGKTTSRSGGS